MALDAGTSGTPDLAKGNDRFAVTGAITAGRFDNDSATMACRTEAPAK
jgi:hypothetical protein